MQFSNEEKNSAQKAGLKELLKMIYKKISDDGEDSPSAAGMQSVAMMPDVPEAKETALIEESRTERMHGDDFEDEDSGEILKNMFRPKKKSGGMLVQMKASAKSAAKKKK